MAGRSKRRYNARPLSKRTQALITLSLGAIAIILSITHLSTSAGAVFGTGRGKAGMLQPCSLTDRHGPGRNGPPSKKAINELFPNHIIFICYFRLSLCNMCSKLLLCDVFISRSIGIGNT